MRTTSWRFIRESKLTELELTALAKCLDARAEREVIHAVHGRPETEKSRSGAGMQAECCLLHQGIEAQNGLEVRAPALFGLLRSIPRIVFVSSRDAIEYAPLTINIIEYHI